MIDLHTHIIPGIDDGAADLKASLAMMEIAAAHGTTAVVVTPHVIEGEWLPSWEKILESCAILRRLVLEAGLKITVYPGAEVALSRDILNLLIEPGPYCINGSSYLLVELPVLEIPAYADDFLFKLQIRGIIPILAHPERNRELRSNLSKLGEWIEKGVLVQMNAPSLMGRMGNEVTQVAELMLNKGMVHCIGSDAHGIDVRRPILSEVSKKIRDMTGEENMIRLLRVNPSHIIRDETFGIQPVKVIRPLKKSSLIKNWMNLVFDIYEH